MPMPRQCSHAERYKDGRCVVCTRKRQVEYQRNYRRAKRLERERLKNPGALTMEELTGQAADPPPHDLL